MGVTLFGDQSPINPVSQATGYDTLSSGIASQTAADAALSDNPTAEALRTAALQQSGLGPIIAGGRGGVIRGAPESPLLQPEDANKQFGIKGTLSWDKPVRLSTATLQNEYATDRLQREDVLNRAETGFLPATARLAASLGASALDPVNVAASFVPVIGEARFATLAGRIGLTGARIARGAAEGAVGQGLIEPIALQNADAEGRDYDAWNSLSNIAMGAGLGAILHVGGGFMHDRLFGVPEFTPPQNHADALSGAIAALVDDRPVRVAEYLSAVDNARRDRLMGGTALSSAGAPEVPLGAVLPEFDRLNTEAAVPGLRGQIDLPTVGENGQPANYPNDTLGFRSEIGRLQDRARTEGRALELRQSENGSSLVEPASFEIVDQFSDEATARANINRMPPAAREGLQTIPFTRADGNQGSAIVRGLDDRQAAAVRQNPELVDQALAKGAGQSAVTDLPDISNEGIRQELRGRFTDSESRELSPEAQRIYDQMPATMRQDADRYYGLSRGISDAEQNHQLDDETIRSFYNTLHELEPAAKKASAWISGLNVVVTDLPDTTGTSFQDAWQGMLRSQRQTHEVQPEQATALAEWRRETVGYDKPIAPAVVDGEAETYAAATEEQLQSLRQQGLLAPEHEAALAAEDENIQQAEARGRGFAQAAACVARGLI